MNERDEQEQKDAARDDAAQAVSDQGDGATGTSEPSTDAPVEQKADAAE